MSTIPSRPDASVPMPVPRPSARRLFGAPLGTDNSLNLIRFVLATAVLVAHSYPLTGRSDQAPPVDVGLWAVAGFFAVSGYLITASRQRTGFAYYLLLRIGRIFPAFLVVLVVTAAVFGPIAQLVNHGTLSGYLTTAPSPTSYVYLNMFLEIGTFAIGDTLSSVPYPDVWNGSLWTLYFEFLCYLIVGVILIWRQARTSVWPIALAFLVSAALNLRPDLVVLAGGSESARLLVSLLPYFLGGALIRLLQPHIGFHWIPGVLSLAGMLLGIQFGPEWLPQLLAPLYAYGLLWLSTVVPQPRWVARNDVSYGVYIYAFPVQQMLALFGLAALNVHLYSAIALVITFAFATASWFWIERPALRRTRIATGRPADR